MLAALLLLGLLPFAAMPILETGFGGGNSPERDPDPDTPNGTEDTPLDEVASDAEDDFAGGTRHAVLPGAGAHAFPDFRPGEDSILLDMTDVGDDLFFDTASLPDGARLSIAFDDDEVMTLDFPGLQDVPVEDIFLSVSDGSGDDPYQVSLGDAAEILGDGVLDPTDPDTPDAPGPDGEADVTDPVDPDTPDTPGPEVDGPVIDPVDPDIADDPDTASDPLDPVDPDAPDTPGPEVTGPVLDPVDPETPDVPGPAGSGDVIDPVDPDAESGWLDGSAAAPAEVTSFSPGEELLRVQVGEGWALDGPPLVKVTPSDEGQDAEVSLNGTRVAVLKGAPFATASDIRLDLTP